MKVKVTTYKGYLIIETLEPEEDKDFLPIKSGRIGCLVSNTSKNLGISEEAWTFLKKLKVVGDDLGDVDAWKAGEIHCFGWIGPLIRVVGPKAVVSNIGIQDIDFIEISNDTSQWIKNAMEQ